MIELQIHVDVVLFFNVKGFLCTWSGNYTRIVKSSKEIITHRIEQRQNEENRKIIMTMSHQYRKPIKQSTMKFIIQLSETHSHPICKPPKTKIKLATPIKNPGDLCVQQDRQIDMDGLG